MAEPIALPKGYKRIDPFALDADSVFSSLVDLEAYVSGPTAYPGHIIALVDNDTNTVSTYKILPDFTYKPIDAFLNVDGSNIEIIAFNENLIRRFTDETVYINPLVGSDETGNGSESLPFATLEHTLSKYQNSIFSGTLTIIIKTGGLDATLNVKSREFSYYLSTISGSIIIQGESVEELSDVTISANDTLRKYNISHASYSFVPNEYDGMFISNTGGVSTNLRGNSIYSNDVDTMLISNDSEITLDTNHYIVRNNITLSFDGDLSAKTKYDTERIRIYNFKIDSNLSRLFVSAYQHLQLRCCTLLVEFRFQSSYIYLNDCYIGLTQIIGQCYLKIINCSIYDFVFFNSNKSLCNINGGIFGKIRYEYIQSVDLQISGDTLFVNFLYQNDSGNYKNTTSLNILQEENCSVEILGEFSLYDDIEGITAVLPNVVGTIPTINTGRFDEKRRLFININNEFTEYNNKHVHNYQTIEEIEALNSDYQFVFCNETGKIYHYENNFIGIADGYYILNTADGGDSRFIDINKKFISVETDVYIDQDNGSDETGDGSNSLPFATINHAVGLYRDYMLLEKLTFSIISSSSEYIVDLNQISLDFKTIDQAGQKLRFNGEMTPIYTGVNINSSNDSRYEYSCDLTMTEDHELKGKRILVNGKYGTIADSYADGTFVFNAAYGGDLVDGSYDIYEHGVIIKDINYGTESKNILDFRSKTNDEYITLNYIDFRIGTGSDIYSSGEFKFCNIICENQIDTSVLFYSKIQNGLLFNTVFIENYRVSLDTNFNYAIRTTFYGNKDLKSEEVLEIYDGGTTEIGQTIVINANIAINISSTSLAMSTGSGSYKDGFYIRDCNTMFDIGGSSKAYFNGYPPNSSYEVRNTPNFGTVADGCHLYLGKGLIGDVPDNVPTSFYDIETNTRIIIPGVSEKNIRNEYPKNYQTIEEIEALNSDYQFVICQATGKIYHYEDNFDEPADSTNILNTVDGGTTRFVNILLLSNNIRTEFLDLIPLNSEPTYKEGRFFYDNIEKSFILMNDISGIRLNIGEELWARFFNNTGNTLLNGQVVYISGADGTNLTVGLCDATNLNKSVRALGVVTIDTLNGGYGYITRYGAVRGLNTSSFNVGDIIWSDPLVPGGYTNIKPTAPDYPIRLGIVMVSDETQGVIGIDTLTFNGTDTSLNLDGSLNGIVIQKPGIDFVVEDGVVYCEVFNQNNPTKNLSFIIGGIRYNLNTLTNIGTDGKARVALTPGVNLNTLQQNYVYIYLNNGIPTLASSTTYPSGDFAGVCYVPIFDVSTTELNGVQIFQRFNNSVNNGDGDGILSYILDRIRRFGASYFAGVDPTLNITSGTPDSVTLSTTSGIVFQLHSQAFDSCDGTEYYIINHPTEPFKKISNLNEIDVDANGNSLLSNNESFGINILGGQNSEGVTDKLYILLPKGNYKNNIDCINDVLNYALSSVPITLATTTFRICRICLRYGSGGNYVNILEEEGIGNFQDERGFPLGNFGGSNGSSSQTSFSDGIFSWFNSTDPTKLVNVDLSQLTTNTLRKLIMTDWDVDLSKYAFDHETVTNAELLDSRFKFIFIAETGLIYNYNATSGEARDGVEILNTADGGDTRFVAIGGAKSVGEAGSVQLSDGNKNMVTSNQLLWDIVNNVLKVGNPVTTSAKLSVKGDSLKTIIAEFFNEIEGVVFEIRNDGSILLSETSEAIVDNGSIWLDANSNYLKLLKDTEEYYLNIDRFANLRDVDWNDPQSGNLPVWNNESGKLENHKTIDDDRLIERIAVGINSSGKLIFQIPASYKILTIIGSEILGFDIGDVIIGSTPGGNDICAGETINANDIDIELQLSKTFFSRNDDTEIYVDGEKISQGLLNLYMLMIKC